MPPADLNDMKRMRRSTCESGNESSTLRLISDAVNEKQTNMEMFPERLKRDNLLHSTWSVYFG